MAGFDVHQHLWPRAFSEALAQRTEAPYLDGDVLHVSEGASTVDLRDHELATRLALLDLHEIDTAVVSLQPSLGLDGARPVRARSARPRSGRTGSSSSPPKLPAGSLRSQSAGRATASRVCRSEPIGWITWTIWRRRSTRCGDGVCSSSTRSPGDPPPSAPAWWPAVVDYTSQMQRAYFAWLSGAQERWPDVTVVFAILAGGAPIQLERLSSRGVDVRSSLHRNVFFDTASYGRRALELCIETFGVEQLVFGTDAPVVDPTPAIRAVDAFGESVSRLIRQDNLIGLLQ